MTVSRQRDPGEPVVLGHQSFTGAGTRVLSRDEVPRMPQDAEFLPFQSKTTACYQKDDCRWRWSVSEPEKLMVFIRYKSSTQRAPGEFPWCERYTDPAA
jgi:hypothetical protein